MPGFVGLLGNKVRLVPLDLQLHLENTVYWLSDPSLTQYLERNLPITRLNEEAYFRRMMESPNDAVWALLDPDGHHIGNTSLQDINWKERCARSATLIGEKTSWGKGYAVDASLVKIKFAFEELGLNRLEADVFVDNAASCKVCEKAGWREEGIARSKYFRRGKWHDVIRYAILADDYYSHRRVSS